MVPAVVSVSRVGRLASGHVGLYRGHRVLAVYVSRRDARKAQRRYNHRHRHTIRED